MPAPTSKLCATPIPDPDRVTLLRKYKLPNHQNGQVYLTSHRLCYIDKAEPRKHSVALDLKDVERYEFYVCIYFTMNLRTCPFWSRH